MGFQGEKGGCLRVATFNVNGIRARMPLLLGWIQRVRPDILALQETKVEDKQFPLAPLKAEGYECVFCGQKGFNGVAVLSRGPIEVIREGLQDRGPLDRERLLMVRTMGLIVLNTYVPQGASPESPRFMYKLQWLGRLKEFMNQNLRPEQHALWMGDFNVAPQPEDVYDPEGLAGQIGFHPLERKALEELREWGWVDIFRLHVKEAGHYTFWDYRLRGALSKGLGWRVDHIWGTRSLAQRSLRAWIDTNPRQEERPSDHTPLLAEFAWNAQCTQSADSKNCYVR
ncbi:MAG: exodeoxyribonuclease III [bacterium]